MNILNKNTSNPKFKSKRQHKIFWRWSLTWNDYLERQFTKVRVNLGSVCKIAEGVLDNAAHLISASSEQRGRVVRNDPGVTKTEIKIKQNYRIMTPKILGKTFVT